MILGFIIIHFIGINCCPFSTYQDGMIEDGQFFESKYVIIPPNDLNGDAFGFGFWIYSLPRITALDDSVQILFKVQNIESDIYSLKGLQILRYSESQYRIGVYYQDQNIEFKESNFDYNSIQYPAKWMFIAITIMLNSQNMIINIDEQYQSIQTKGVETNQIYQIIIGADAEYFQEFAFKGKLSKLIIFDQFFYSTDKIENFRQICQIPPQVADEQIINIVNGLMIIQDNTLIIKQFYQLGNKYCISGWIKYSINNIIVKKKYRLLRLTTNFQYKNGPGDDLFTVEANLNNNIRQQSRIRVKIDSYCMESYECKLAFISSNIHYYLLFEFLNLQNDYYYQGLQQWHFMQYEYGRNNLTHDFLSIQFQFFNNLGLQQFTYSAIRLTPYMVGNMFLIINQQDVNLDPLQAKLSNINFFHNYKDDKEFILSCHYSCNTCDGPSNINCLSCKNHSNRNINEEKKICECIDEFQDDGYSESCQKIDKQFQTIIQEELIQTDFQQCPFGYFNLKSSLGYFTYQNCPSYNKDVLLCIECILNPETWYLQPICKTDLIQRGKYDDDAFNYYNRKENEIDLFFINQDNMLQLHEGFQSFCDYQNLDNDCIQTKFTHLGQYVYIKCKQNYQFYNNDCIQKDILCNSYDQFNNCIECTSLKMYLYDQKCLICPKICKSCIYDEIIQSPICTSCEEQQTLFNGDCLNCGNFCKICEIDSYTLIQKCLKCIDDSQYYISIDQVNCNKNLINGCKFVVEYFPQQNWDFPLNSMGLAIVCVKCFPFTIFNVQSNQCEEDTNYQDYDPILYPHKCYSSFINIYNQKKCQIAEDITFAPTFSLQCVLYLVNCIYCHHNIYSGKLNDYQCLVCQNGYYVDRLSKICKPCKEPQNCAQCAEQQIQSQDYWTWELYPFVHVLGLQIEQIFKIKQSNNQNDYELICLSCNEGFDLYKNKCIKSCPDDCQECEIIDDENICVRCSMTQNGRMLSLLNNQCIGCSQNCALCQIRNQEELQLINPFFNNQQFQFFSYKCLRSFDDGKNYVYDNFIGNYVICKDEEKQCFHQFTIPLNLYCDYDLFQQNLNQVQTEQKKTFMQQNIFLDDLISDQNFLEFQNENFYSFANQKFIRSIKIQISSNEPQYCRFKKDNAIIQQIFGQNIFSVTNVEIEFYFTQQTIFEIQKEIQFKNFNKITFYGINFQLSSQNQDSGIQLFGFYPISFQLLNSKFTQNSLNNENFYIKSQNVIVSTIKNLQFINLVGQINFQFQSNNQTQNLKHYLFEDLNYENCDFFDGSLFNLQLSDYDDVTFRRIDVKGKFSNMSFLNHQSTNINANFRIEKFYFEGIIQDTDKFLELNFYNFVTIEDMQILNSKIFKSNLINLNAKNILNLITFQKNSISQNSTFLNNLYTKESDQDFKMNHIILEHNQYDSSIYLIRLKNISEFDSYLEIYNLKILNNFSPSITIEFQQFEKALIFIEIQNIMINQLEIAKGYGMIEITISKCVNLVIQLVQIYSQQFKILGLHQFLDCMLAKIDSKLFKESIFVFNSQYVQFIDFEVTQLSVFNYPILSYKSTDIYQFLTNEKIIMKNIKMKNNLIIQTKSEKMAALIQIYTQQQSQILIENLEIFQNILHEYVQSALFMPSAILSIVGELSEINLTFLNFQQNLITNSTDNLLFINCKSFTLKNGIFIENNIFNYHVLQRHLLWGFEQFDDVNIETIKGHFQIKSLTGNGFFVAQNINILNTEFKVSSGKQGGAFQFKLKNSAIVNVNNISIISILNSFDEYSKTSGAIYIDLQSSQQALIQFFYINAIDIFSRSLGSLFYLEQGQCQVNLFLKNLKISNIYSLGGSIVYASFSQSIKLQSVIQVFNINIKNTIEGQLQFLSHFKNIQEQDQNSLIFDRSLLYINQITLLKCQNFIINGLLFENFLTVASINEIYLENINIDESQVSSKLINIFPNLYSNSTIFITNVQLTNISIGSIDFSFECQQFNENLLIDNFKCLNKIIASPSSLNFAQKNSSFDNAKCLFNTLQQQLIDKIYSNQSQYQAYSVLFFSDFSQSINLRLLRINVYKINCSQCQEGIINLAYSGTQKNIELKTIKILNSLCGQKGCINIKKTQTSQRQLQVNDFKANDKDFEAVLKKIYCTNNFAQNGCCLNINNSTIYLQDSIFENNQAFNSGGAIQYTGNQQFLLFKNVFQNNTASIGGGIYFQNQMTQDQITNYNLFKQNYATLYGENILTQPEKLFIRFQKNQQNSVTNIKQEELIKIDQIQFQINSTYSQSSIYENVPSGQQISKYQFFNWKTSTYSQTNFIFRISALTQNQEVVKQLNNSYCNILGRKFDIKTQSSEDEFLSNYTNINIVYFNSLTQDYSLDDMVIYFDSDQSSNIVLQLQINCSSIVVPVYNQSFPFNLINQHSNYYIRINFKTFPCQYGEIKNQTDFSCHICDSNTGLFSLTIDSNKCELQDEQTTINVKPAQLQLRSGYWRPYFSTSQIEKCFNLEQNCLGGWIEGDTSCLIGHVGALCEQCDLYNLRGNGQFTISDQYQCGKCSDQVRNAIMIVIVVIWTIISLFISTSGVLKIQEEYLKPSPFFKIRFTRNLNKSQSSALIKMLTSYLQIIASITTFQLNLPIGFTTTINAAGNPIQTMAYSLDCFLASLFPIDIQYGRIIWQLITPFFYITIFIGIYRLAAQFKLVNYTFSVFCTSILYICIYFQPNLVGGLIQLLSFREISGFKWIQANVSIRYDTDIHFKWMLQFCFPIIIILAIFLPLFLFWKLYKNQNNLDSKSVRNIWGYLYHEYKNNAYFWEIVKILEKELVIIILKFYEDSIIIKGVIIQFITYIYCELNQKYSPYYLKNLNTLDYYSANVCMITIGLALGAYVSQLQDAEEVKIPIYIIMVILNLQFLLQILFKILAEYLKLISNLLQIMKTQIILHFPGVQKNQFLSKHIFKNNIQSQRIEYLLLTFRSLSNQIGRQSLIQKKQLFESTSSGKMFTTSGKMQKDYKFYLFKSPESVADISDKRSNDIL